MSVRILICFILLATGLQAQRVRIEGLAPAYVGKTIELYEIEDYFSFRERLITGTTVGSDSTFSFSTSVPHVQQLIIRCNNNTGFIYAQPNASYRVFFPEKDAYDVYRPTGNQVEVAFYDLDSTDINYKILSFQRWVDHFVGGNYYLKDVKPQEFVESLDRFKTNVEKAYAADTGTFFKTYVRFTVASLDNIQHAAARNRYEKHDFYIKFTPVQYENDAYMSYINGFYQNLLPRLATETNEAVYQGILKSSPTLIMRALGSEYTLINLRIREMVMIKSLADVYHSGSYPQTNINTILDSVATHSMFKANGIIARNMKFRLNELVKGGKAPDFVFSDGTNEAKTLYAYSGKHLYIHVFDPNSLENRKELALLRFLHEQYGNYVQFVSVYKATGDASTNLDSIRATLKWDVYALPEQASFWKNYRIESYPHYVLIDAAGYIVGSPALTPRPNGQYETIDKTFFELKKAVDEMNKR